MNKENQKYNQIMSLVQKWFFDNERILRSFDDNLLFRMIRNRIIEEAEKKNIYIGLIESKKLLDTIVYNINEESNRRNKNVSALRGGVDLSIYGWLIGIVALAVLLMAMFWNPVLNNLPVAFAILGIAIAFYIHQLAFNYKSIVTKLEHKYNAVYSLLKEIENKKKEEWPDNDTKQEEEMILNLSKIVKE